MARLNILTQDEINSLYAIPSLDDEERSFVFSLDSLENNIARKVDYILQLGYYRAVNYFFLFSFQRVKADTAFIMQLYFPEEPFPKKQVSKNHHYRNRCEVMRKFGLKEADTGLQTQLLKEAKVLVKRHSLAKFVLEGLLIYCQQQNVIRPAYSTFQDIVSTALQEERNRLVNKLYTDADKALRAQLDKLLQNDELFITSHYSKRIRKISVPRKSKIAWPNNN
jgi:hypothetical protein